ARLARLAALRLGLAGLGRARLPAAPFGEPGFPRLARRLGLRRGRLAGAAPRLAIATPRLLDELLVAGARHQPELDPARLEVDARDLYVDGIGETVALAGTLAAQLVTRLVVLEIFPAQLGDVDHPLDEQGVERDEHAERRHAGDAARELLPDALAHVLALEPGLDVARGLVGTALVLRAGQADRFPGLPLRLVGLGSAPLPARQPIALALDQRLDHPMVQQVRIAPDRRSEMRIGLVGEAEVAAVLGGVDRLLHRAKQHRLEQLRIRPPLDLAGQLRI